MSEAKITSWWNTVPGMLTGAAAVITAVSGLLLALSQAGWLGGRNAATADTAQVIRESTVPLTQAPSPSKGSAAPAPSKLAPAMQQIKVGYGAFTLLDVATEQRTPTESGLRIRIRLHNTSSLLVNFWDDSFRLLVDDIPRAPVGGLNKVIAGNAADEGDVEFNFPNNANSLVLKIRYYGTEADIPLRRQPIELN